METKTSFWEKLRGWGEVVAGSVALGTVIYALVVWNLFGDFLGVHWDLEVILNVIFVGVALIVAPKVILQGLRRAGILNKKEERILLAESNED
ncbi:MAG: hypothetical protein AAF740_09000 [Bacteroidota bacterium]